MAKSVRWDLIADPRRFQQGFRQAERSTHQLGASVKRFAGIAAAGFAAAGVAQFAKDSVSMAATFDRTMRQVATVAKVPTSGISKLRDTALDMGAKTSFSARQAGDAMLELAKGGLSAAQIKAGGLSATLTLAAAGGLELGESANFVVKSLQTFGLRVDKAADVAAALAGGANASTASVQDLGEALSQVGPGARNAGLSLQETVGALAAFSDNGIRGSDAGTSLKTMLVNLIPQTSRAANAMRKLGLDFTDAHGAVIPLTQIAQQLQDKLKGLSEEQRIAALQTIFGSDATRAATVLMQEGAKGLARYIKATKDRGAAEALAKANTEGAAGAFERLRGAVETVQIKLGTALLPKLAEFATFIAEKAIPRVEEFFKGLRDDLLPHLDRMKRAWEDNKSALKNLLDQLIDADGRLETTGDKAQSLADTVTTLTEGLGGASRFLTGVADKLNILEAGLSAAGKTMHAQFTVPFIDDLRKLGGFFLETARGIIRVQATVAEALHLPQAKALRKAEQSIRDYRVFFNQQMDALKNEDVAIRATFGWKGLEVFRTKSGKAMFAEGGRVDGPGTETSDSVLARLSRGEFVINAAAAKQIGYGELERLNAMRFATGGQVGVRPHLTLPPQREVTSHLDQFEGTIQRILNLATTAFRNTLNLTGAAVPHRPGGWQVAASFLRSIGIPFDIISTFRPGARTHASGRQSYHALNRAMDVVGPNMLRIFQALSRTNPTELIYSRAPFYIARGVRKPISRLDAITRADHYSHVHAAYGNGTPFVPRTGAYLLHQGERVVPAAANRPGGAEMRVGSEIDYHRLADAIVAAFHRSPIQLDRARVSKQVATGALLNARLT